MSAVNCYVTHLESPIDGTRFAPGLIHGTHLGRPLVVEYDLPGIRAATSPEDWRTRQPGMWRYRELLPLPFDQEVVSLGETATPLLACPRLGKTLGVPRLVIKDESLLPTGSFKSRGMSVALSMARYLGLKRLAAPTAGNAGGALAAYCARAGLEAFVFMPEDTLVVNRLETVLYGAKAFLVNGLIHECGALVRENAAEFQWFDMSTLREPYRLEGKKTMGLELADQRDWTLPDVILYPTGGGTGLVGMAKAFTELRNLCWLRNETMPRFYACQSSGCTPLVNAWKAGTRHAETVNNAATRASGLRVPGAVGDFMILDAVRQSNGAVIAGDEARIDYQMRRACALEGVPLCPETAVCLEVLEGLVRNGAVGDHEDVLVWNTGAAQKYVECMENPMQQIDKHKPLVDQLEVASRPRK